MARDGSQAALRRDSPTSAAVTSRQAAAWAAWRPSVVVALAAFAATRAVVWGAGVAAAGLAGLSGRAEDFDPAGVTHPFGAAADLLLAPAARWDAVWYLAIAHDGYRSGASAAFFPLYPALARVVGAPLGSVLLGGLAVSLVAGVAGLAVVHRLAVLELGGAAAWRAVVLLACFPGALFLSAVYSEALFIALSAGSVLAARTGRWPWAGALGALAAATRSAGVLVLVALALLWWSRAPGGPRRWRDAAWLALVPAGLGAFCAGLALGGMDGLAPLHAQEQWFRHFAGPFVGAWDGALAAFEGARQLFSGARSPVYFTQAAGDPYAVAAHNLELFAALLAAVPAVVGTLRRLRPAYGAYVVVALALPLSWPVTPQPLMSLPRFELVLFPLFMWLGWWAAQGRRRLVALAAPLLALQALAAAEFATWHWVA